MQHEAFCIMFYSVCPLKSFIKSGHFFGHGSTVAKGTLGGTLSHPAANKSVLDHSSIPEETFTTQMIQHKCDESLLN